jgi:predicted Holliday junction resolvase-like endonuclease
VVGIGEASAAISSIKTAVEMLKGIHAVKTQVDINSAVIDIQRVLLDAQASALQDRQRQMELMKNIEDLERKITEFQNDILDKSRYHLTEFPTGNFAYVLKIDRANGDPIHKICANCFNEGVKTILQIIRKHSGGELAQCKRCEKSILLHPFPDIQVPRTRNSWME